MRRIGWVTVAMGAVLSLPALAHAQSGVVHDSRVGGRNDLDPVVLESQAQAFFGTPKRYGDAAKLYVRAAEIRVAGDPQRIMDLMMASRMSYYDGSTTRAWEIMERAAEEALAAGDVVNAAHAFVDASFLAKEAGANTRVIELARRAQLLTSSPLLETAQREAILSRIGEPGA